MENKKMENIIFNFADRIQNISYIEKTLEEIRKKSGSKISFSSFFSDFPFICMFFAEMDRQYPGKNFDETAHMILSRGLEVSSKIPRSSLSIISGISGIALAANCMSKNGTRYQSFLKNINNTILQKTEEFIKQIEKKPVKEEYYDTINGISSILSYLMLYIDDPKIKNVFEKGIKYLIDICDFSDEKKLPKIAIETSNTEYMESDNPNGVYYINLGFSHGLSGVLAILTQAYNAGIKMPNQLKTIEKITEYLMHCYIENENDIGCRNIMLYDHELNELETPLGRDAWCYGTPGASYALLIASELLGNESGKKLACESMKCSMKRFKGIVSPIVCHGFSGIYCIAKKFYEHTNDIQFKENYLKLEDIIMDTYDEDAPFFFTDKVIDKNGNSDKIEYKDGLDFLTGASGIALTLLSFQHPAKTPWQSALLLR